MPNFSAKDALFRFNAGFFSARIGEWLYTVALNWLVLVETASPLALALVNACRLLPTLFFSVPGGCLADRLDCRWLNIFNNALNALLILLTGLVFALELPFAWCAVLVALRAVVTAAEPPFRNTYLCRSYSGLSLKSVVAQNATVMNLGKIVGPVLGGFLLAIWGGWATFVVAALFTGMFSIVLMGLPSEESKCTGVEGVCLQPAPSSRSLLSHFRERPVLKQLTLLSIPVMFFGFPYTAMLPVVTETMLGLGPEQFGALLSISSVGALLASTRLGYRPELSSWSATLRYSAAFALSVAGLAAVSGFFTAAVVLFAVGYLGQACRSCSRMCYQDAVPKEAAGRLLGVALMDKGIIPLGGLALGALAEFWDARTALAVMGVAGIVAVLPFFRWRPKRLGVVLTCMLFAPWLVGCTQSEPAASHPAAPISSADSVAIEHAWGEAELQRSPERIVALDLPFLDVFTALGQPVVGFAGTSEKAPPAYLAERLAPLGEPIFVGERKQPNLEVILSLEPDLIVASPFKHNLIADQLEPLAPTIALSDASFGEVLVAVEALAEITGREAQGEALLEQIEERLEQVSGLLAREEPYTVMVVGAFGGEFTTWTRSSFVATLLEELDLVYAFTGPSTASESQMEVAKITIESLSSIDPDVLFLYGELEGENRGELFTGLKAVREKRLFLVDRDLWSRSRGPLAALSILEQCAEFLGTAPERPAQASEAAATIESSHHRS